MRLTRKVADRYEKGGVQGLIPLSAATTLDEALRVVDTLGEIASQRHPVEIYAKAPNKRVEMLDAPENRGATGRGHDGTTGWSMNMTETGLRYLEGAELAGAQRESDSYRQIRLDRLYVRLAVVGREGRGGREVYVVDATPESGNPEKLYFDVETGLLSRRDMVYGKTPVQHYYEDYRNVDGIKLPFVVRSEGPVKVITRLTEIKHNVPIEDARFKSPSN